MVYRGSSQQNEIAQLQSEIYNEIQRDAEPIARGVFGGDNKGMTDMRGVSNDFLDNLYRQKYASGDRQWLVGEAHRDPNQFMQVSERIGVQMPDPNQPPPSPVVAPPTAPVVPMGPTSPMQPMPVAPPSMVPPPMPMASPPMMPPVVGGPVVPPPVPQLPPGQPIPAMAHGGVVTQPTVALIGEQGPEAVVPLSYAQQLENVRQMIARAQQQQLGQPVMGQVVPNPQMPSGPPVVMPDMPAGLQAQPAVTPPVLMPPVSSVVPRLRRVQPLS